jgi:hypothetical protein
VKRHSRWLQLVAIAVCSLLLLWVASSVLRGKGALVCAAGACAVAFALRRAAGGQPAALFRTFLLAALAAATVGLMEGTLHLFPGLLHGWLGNYVYDSYATDGGIYELDPHLGRALRPGVRRQMYWNDHRWTHRTNAAGYRGPRLQRANAVFLGDSMVYGHGVEDDETVPSRFAQATGLSAANLGQQATCLIQAALLLERKGLPLRPRIVFVCSHHTDLSDATIWYDPAEVRKFVADERYLPMARYVDELGQQRDAPPRRNLLDQWAVHVALPLRSARLLYGLLRHPAHDEFTVPAETHGVFVPARALLDASIDTLDDRRLGWTAHRAAVLRMKRLCDAAGAQLILFDPGFPTVFSTAIEALAGEVGARYSPAGRLVLARAQKGEEVYLAKDGHWSPYGSTLMAAALAESATSPGQQDDPARKLSAVR